MLKWIFIGLVLGVSVMKGVWAKQKIGKFDSGVQITDELGADATSQPYMIGGHVRPNRRQ